MLLDYLLQVQGNRVCVQSLPDVVSVAVLLRYAWWTQKRCLRLMKMRRISALETVTMRAQLDSRLVTLLKVSWMDQKHVEDVTKINYSDLRGMQAYFPAVSKESALGVTSHVPVGGIALLVQRRLLPQWLCTMAATMSLAAPMSLVSIACQVNSVLQALTSAQFEGPAHLQMCCSHELSAGLSVLFKVIFTEISN